MCYTEPLFPLVVEPKSSRTLCQNLNGEVFHCIQIDTGFIITGNWSSSAHMENEVMVFTIHNLDRSRPSWRPHEFISLILHSGSAWEFGFARDNCTFCITGGICEMWREQRAFMCELVQQLFTATNVVTDLDNFKRRQEENWWSGGWVFELLLAVPTNRKIYVQRPYAVGYQLLVIYNRTEK